jgi:hypothetical protein
MGWLFTNVYNELIQEDRGIPILFGTPATELIQNVETKEILGVYAEDPDGNKIAVKVLKGVILALAVLSIMMN